MTYEERINKLKNGSDTAIWAANDIESLINYLNCALESDKKQIAESAGVDFETNMWTFKMNEGFIAGAGKYIIIKLKNIDT